MKAQLIARCCDGITTAQELESLYESDKEITFKTFCRNVSLKEVSEMFGYAYGRWQKGVRLEKDWGGIKFFRSKFRGNKCYHLVWSAIDHIYVKP